MSKFQNRSQSQYIFQKKRTSFTRRLFTKGLNVAGLILIGLQEMGEMFLEGLPSPYPQFRTLKQIFGVRPYKKIKLKKNIIDTNLSRLEKQGLVIKDSKKKVYCLTEEGEKFVSYIKNRYEILKKPWDGKIRVVIFDIPEKKEKWRRWLRDELQLLQFKLLQKSVYIGKTALPKSLYQDIIQSGLSQYIFIFTMSEFDRKQIMKILEPV